MTKLAYIKGEEEKALWYYSQRIKYEIDPKERGRLEQIINELRDYLKSKPVEGSSPSDNEMTLTSISLSTHA